MNSNARVLTTSRPRDTARIRTIRRMPFRVSMAQKQCTVIAWMGGKRCFWVGVVLMNGAHTRQRDGLTLAELVRDVVG